MRIPSRPSWLLLAALFVTGSCAPRPQPAELVLLGGKVVTMEPARPQVRALAARGGVIVALGDDAEVRPYIGSTTRVIELEGRMALPGFIEGHGHFTALGSSLMDLDLRSARTWEEIVQRVAAAARQAEPGNWIIGWGWHQEKWDAPASAAVDGYPTHHALSRVSPRNPVLLNHASGHAGLLNAAALGQLGLDARTTDPAAGKILRDGEGVPTGLLVETAYRQALAAHADLQERSTDQSARRAVREIELAARECLSKGVTSFQDAGSDFDTVDRLRQMAERGQLGVRLWVMLKEDNPALAQRIEDYRMLDAADQHLTVRAIKRMIDGALGSHSAWLLAPYADQPDSHGLNTLPLSELEHTARIALDHGFQLCVHAIGDRANRETLDLFERFLAQTEGARELRWRIEHAQHLSQQDIPRFAQLGVVASMQAVHCTSDAPWVPQRLGDERAATGAYVWRKLLDSGAVISNGTDAPVEDVNPIANFHAAVTRRTRAGSTFYPEQRMTRIEALQASSLHAAYAAFEEQSKGSLASGKLADIVVLSQDLLTVPEERILETQVLFTIVGGKVLYERPE